MIEKIVVGVFFVIACLIALAIFGLFCITAYEIGRWIHRMVIDRIFDGRLR